MSICKNCRDLASKSRHAFTEHERIHLLASATSMHNIIMDSPRATELDKVVNNSVITKLLLSLDPGKRESLLRGFQEQAGLRITSTSCPHTPLEVVG